MPIDSQLFRHVLGQYPTGVSAITAREGLDRPVAQIVGTFTSVSLDPPLVAFLPAKTSRSWVSIRTSGRFCVNVLAEDQRALCQTIFQGGSDLFDKLLHRLTPGGNPSFDGCLAWIDCTIWAVHDAGDHDIVIGLVQNIAEGASSKPLLFFRRGYGKFETLD